jgi:hypothetical protein
MTFSGFGAYQTLIVNIGLGFYQDSTVPGDFKFAIFDHVNILTIFTLIIDGLAPTETFLCKAID